MIVLLFLTLGLVLGSHGAPSSQNYWKSVLPNTVMPKAISELKEVQSISGKEVKNGNWAVETKLARSLSDYLKYKVSSIKDQNPNHLSMFFLEKDIHTGSLMNMDFTQNPSYYNSPSFLSRKVSNSIPFSSTQFPQILTRFDIKPESKDAKVMKSTIAECERPTMKGEDKFCATSLESMVDFITSKVGKNVVAISTETEGKVSKIQNYKIANGLVKMNKNMKSSDKIVVCHKENYPYAVFYCHVLVKTRAYVVPLVGSDGEKVNAVVVCHTDTSEWNPKHLSMQMLKVKPGTSTICHFLQSQQFVCLPKN